MFNTRIHWLLLANFAITSHFQTCLGLGETPQMGWNSWNAFKSAVNSTVIEETVELFETLGLKKAGYEYVLIDEGWANYSRTADGFLQVNQTAFPQGIPALAQSVHANGLKLGLYGDSGHYTCGWRPGSWGYEERDAQTFAGWGVDYLKYDNCGGFEAMTEAPQVRFGAMKNALLLSGRDIFYSVCEWGYQFPWHWGGCESFAISTEYSDINAAFPPAIGHSYRISGDITTSFANETACQCKTAYCLNTGYAGCSVLTIIKKMKEISQYQTPGHWLDMDMLEIGNMAMTTYEEQTHFAFWAALKSPLIIGADLSKISNTTLAVLTNKEIIALNQDSLGRPVTYLDSLSQNELFQVWAGEIEGGYVVLLFNERSYSQTTTLKFSELGFGTPRKTVELWSMKTLRNPKLFNGTLEAYQTLAFKLTV
ncbi:alpha-galactosidase/alpha-n-acetylgalactosaminidase [Penicillium herquei]|nr:alpha-galactosidase/alpha-n-acetylgalactosaminidase [Penicillium herquei]